MKLLLSFVVLLVSLQAFSSACDSIGVRTKGGRSFILHKVEAGETLYRLSKRYNVAVSSIERANTIEGGLSVGQVLWIPTTYKIEEPKEDVQFHTVQSGQTLYAISKLYDASVDDIKEWNNLTSNELSVGQKIIVAKVTVVPTTVTVAKDTVEIDEQVKGSNNVKVAIKKKEVISKQKKTSYNPQKQIGLVVLGTEEKLNYKFSYCLHPTAPIGTIMVLTCSFNDRVILVKVVGNTSMEEGVILKVNKSVFDSLSIDNESFDAEVTYLD
jgi:LysM repeat protein